MKKLFSILILITFGAVVFAADLSSLNKALASKKTEQVSKILSESSEEDKKEIEDRILDEAKNQVIKDDLDYAYRLSEIVLMFDFENTEAQKLFTSIDKAKKSKAEKQARDAEKKELEEYKAAKEREKEEQIAAGIISRYNFPISVELIPLNLNLSRSELTDEYNQKNNLAFRYGFGCAGDVGFENKFFDLNLHVLFTYDPLVFMGENSKMDFNTRFTVGAPSFSKWFRISIGYKYFKYLGEKNNALYEAAGGPTVGIGVEQISFGNFTFGAFFDLDMVFLDSSNAIDFASDFDLIVKYYLPVKLFGDSKLFVKNETMASFVRVINKNEWSVDSAFSVGITFNEK